MNTTVMCPRCRKEVVGYSSQGKVCESCYDLFMQEHLDNCHVTRLEVFTRSEVELIVDGIRTLQTLDITESDRIERYLNLIYCLQRAVDRRVR